MVTKQTLVKLFSLLTNINVNDKVLDVGFISQYCFFIGIYIYIYIVQDYDDKKKLYQVKFLVWFGTPMINMVGFLKRSSNLYFYSNDKLVYMLRQ